MAKLPSQVPHVQGHRLALQESDNLQKSKVHHILQKSLQSQVGYFRYRPRHPQWIHCPILNSLQKGHGEGSSLQGSNKNLG